MVVVGQDEGVDSARELHMGAVFKEKKMWKASVWKVGVLFSKR